MRTVVELPARPSRICLHIGASSVPFSDFCNIRLIIIEHDRILTRGFRRAVSDPGPTARTVVSTPMQVDDTVDRAASAIALMEASSRPGSGPGPGKGTASAAASHRIPADAGADANNRASSRPGGTASRAPFVVIRSDRMALASPAAVSALGRPVDDLLRIGLPELLCPDEVSRFREAVGETSSTNRTTREFPIGLHSVCSSWSERRFYLRPRRNGDRVIVVPGPADGQAETRATSGGVTAPLRSPDTEAGANRQQQTVGGDARRASGEAGQRSAGPDRPSTDPGSVFGDGTRPTFEGAAPSQRQSSGSSESWFDWALERDELCLHHQPIVRISDRSVVAAEALVRWRHPEKGLLAAGEFIDEIEAAGRVPELDVWVLRRLLEGGASRVPGRRALDDEQPGWRSVNISGTTLDSEEAIERIERLLRLHPGAASSILFEVTEKSAVSSPSVAAERLRRLRALGARIALDDFGTGHSSLAYLEELPVDQLKLDRLFLKHLKRRNGSGNLPAKIIELGHALDLQVVVEGVEEEALFDWATGGHADFMQGYYLGRPVPTKNWREMSRRFSREA